MTQISLDTLKAAKTAVRARRVDPAKSSEAAKKLNAKAKEIKDAADGIYKSSKANKKAALKLNKTLKKHASGTRIIFVLSIFVLTR